MKRFIVTLFTLLLMLSAGEAKTEDISKGVIKINQLIDSFGRIQHCDCNMELEEHYEKNIENLENFFKQAVIHLAEGNVKDFQFRPVKCRPTKGQAVAEEAGAAALSRRNGGSASSAAVKWVEARDMEIACQFKASFYAIDLDRTINVDGVVEYRTDRDCPPTDAKTPCVRMKIAKAKLDRPYFFVSDVTDKVLEMAEKLDYSNVKVSEDRNIITFEKQKSEKE